MTAATLATRPLPARRPRTTALAGAGYVAAWVVGLTAFPAGPAADAARSAVVEHVTDHRLATALQSIAVHGVAAALLAVVLAGGVRAGRLPRPAAIAGAVGVGLSLGQLALGLWRSAVASGDAIATLAGAIDRVDGLKLVAFAAMIGAALPALRRDGLAGRPMAALSAAAVASLALAGVAFLLDVEPLVAAAALALVLLLAWVARFGALAGRS